MMGQASMESVKQRPQERGELLEYSVVYTDRAVNLMSEPFQKVMRDISENLRAVYNAQHVALIPGSGSYAMEAVARQFATDKTVLVIRNGFFSFRWSDIFNVCKIPKREIVLKAEHGPKGVEKPEFAPYPLNKALDEIIANKPAVVFAPQVETATGIVLTREYISEIGKAVRSYGGLFVLDSIAAGSLWLDIEKNYVDVLISAPQKGWSGPACCGIVVMNDRAKSLVDSTDSTSFCCNLKKWLEVMKKYEEGSFMYYTTLPTDSLTTLRNAILETKDFGFDKIQQRAVELGTKIRAVLAKNGFDSVARSDCAAPTVVVVYGREKGVNMVAKFKENGLQVAGGVPFKVDEPEGLVTFRVGLFGLDKLKDVDRTVKAFEAALLKTIA